MNCLTSPCFNKQTNKKVSIGLSAKNNLLRILEDNGIFLAPPYKICRINLSKRFLQSKLHNGEEILKTSHNHELEELVD